MRKLLYFIFIFQFILTSCNQKKKYYYKEDDKEEQTFYAYSDSTAYLEAYQSFAISKKIFKDMINKFQSSSIKEPNGFVLFNGKHEDITNSTFIRNKDSLEKAIEYNIYHLPKNDDSVFVTPASDKMNLSDSKFDTLGLYLAPVKILSAKFVKKEYSTYKDVELRFKNISNKKIAAIRFKWYGENSFNEPADMTGLIHGWGTGFTDDALRPGATDYGVWNALSKDGKKIILAYPYEVAFDDGTKWGLQK